MSEYLSDNPLFIVNGFRKAGISSALSGTDQDGTESEAEEEEDDTYSD